MSYTPDVLKIHVGPYPDDDEDGNDLENIAGMYLDAKPPNSEWVDRVLFVAYPAEDFMYTPTTDGQYAFRGRVAVWMAGEGSTHIVGPPGPTVNKSVRVSAPKAPPQPTITENYPPLVQTED